MRKLTKKAAAVLLVIILVVQSIIVAMPYSDFGITAEASSEEKTYVEKARMEYNGHTYALFDDAVTWEEAFDICNAKGGHLVAIADFYEKDKLAEFITLGDTSGYWLGLSYFGMGLSSGYQWVTGESNSICYGIISPFDLRASLTHNVVLIQKKNGKFIDADNNERHGFICEWELSNSLSRYSNKTLTVRDHNGNVVPYATVKVFYGSDNYREALRSEDYTTNSNGEVNINISKLYLNGWVSYQIKDANVVAYKDYYQTDSNYYMFDYDDCDDVKYTIRMSSEDVKEGVWKSGKLNSIGSKLELKQPQMRVNLRVVYDNNYDSPKDTIRYASYYLANATDGMLYINNVRLIKKSSNKEVLNYNESLVDVKLMSSQYGNDTVDENGNVIKGSIFDEYRGNAKPDGFSIGGGAARVGEEDSTKEQGKVLAHELSHYVNNLADEYCNPYKYASNADRNEFIYYMNNLIGSWKDLGVMDSYGDMEYSIRSDYDYLRDDASLSDQQKRSNMTFHFAYSGGLDNYRYGDTVESIDLCSVRLNDGKSCWESFVSKLSQFCSEAGVKNVTIDPAEGDHSEKYEYAQNVDFGERGASPAIKARAMRRSNNGGYMQEGSIAEITSSLSEENVIFTVKPLVEGADYKATVLDENGERDIPLDQNGENYTALVSVPVGVRVWFSVKAEKDGVSAQTDTNIIGCTGTENVFVGEEDTRTYAVLSSQSETNFSLAKTFDSVQPESGYYSVSPVVGLSATATATGKIFSSVAMESDIDQSSLKWYFNNGNGWQTLTSDVTMSYDTKGKICASASADYEGNGLYCLAAKKSDTTINIAAVSNVTATCDSTTSHVTLHFNDSNTSYYDESAGTEDYTTAGKVRYYDVYYSTMSSFIFDDDETFTSRYTADEDITLLVDEPGQNYYFKVVAVSNSGAKSEPSDTLALMVPLADRDSDGIPDEYCDNFGLWGWDDEEKEIASSDDDGDGLTNLEEYNFGSNPILADTDGDGVADNMEQAKGLDPNKQMTDGVTPDFVVVYGNPDLCVTAEDVMVSPLSYNEGDDVNVNITIENKSTCISPDVYVYAKCGDEIVGEWMVSVIGGESVNFDASFAAPADMGEITIAVDENKEGYDSDYSNNTYTFVPLTADEAESVQAVIDAIESIPASIDRDDYAAVLNAYDLYSPLSDKLKSYVYPKYVDKLMVSYEVVVRASYDFSDELIDLVANKMFDLSGTSVDVSAYNLIKDDYVIDALNTAIQNKYPVEYDIARIGSSSYSYSGSKIMSIRYSYQSAQSVDTFNSKVKELKKKVNDICNSIEGKSDFEKIVAVHDYLITNGEYDESLAAHTGYELLIKNTGVCEAYMSAFHMIMSYAGIPCVCVISEEMVHAWNLVQIEDSWYHVDCTWDDPVPNREGESQYTYLLLNDEEMKLRGHYNWISPVLTAAGEFVAMPRTTNQQQYLYNERWYFYDEADSSIVSSDIYGSDEKTLCTDATGGIVVYDGYAYYGSDKSIKRVSLESGESETVYTMPQSEIGNFSSNMPVLITKLILDDDGILSYVYQSWENIEDNLYMSVEKDGGKIFDLKELVIIKSISLNKSTAELEVGDTLTLTATTDPVVSSDSIYWTTSDETVATVENGVVTAVSEGVCTITAEAGYCSSKCDIIVEADGNVIAVGTCNDNLTWTLDDDGTLTICGNGELNDFLWYNNSFIKKIIFEYGVAKIGGYAFYGCSELQNVTIPSSVEYIGDFAFYECNKLAEVSIPNSVKHIGDFAFYDCSRLAKASIPDGATYIGNCAFNNCSSLTSATIPSSLANESIGLFSSCSELVCAKIADGVNAIPLSAFENCSKLTNVTIPDSVTAIHANAFSNCSKLSNLSIPKNVKDIEKNVFFGCNSLNNIYYAGSAKEWQSIHIDTGNDTLLNARLYFNSPSITLNTSSLCLSIEEESILNAELVAPDEIVSLLSWYSDDKDIATVDANGKVTAVGVGKATITAVAGAYSASCEITVSKATITLDKSTVVMTTNDTGVQLTAATDPVEIAGKLTWESSDTKIATVDSTGKINPVGIGSATIKASVAGSFSTCTVEVVPPITLSALGGSVRIVDPYGLRFGIQLLKDDAYKQYKDIITGYGTLIIPKKNLGDNALTFATDKVKDVPAVNIYSEDDSQLTYTGVLVGIPKTSFYSNIVGRGYLKYKDIYGNEKVMYTDEIVRSYYQVADSAYTRYGKMTNRTETEESVYQKLGALLAEMTDGDNLTNY